MPMRERGLFLFGVFLFLFGLLIGLGALAKRGKGEPLPVYKALPAFSLTERSGRPVGRDDLRGNVWIFDFVFTRCAGPCPALTARMGALRHELPPAVRFATVTVDPDWDTPDRLAAYARQAGADDADRWWFLTGPKPAVVSLVVDGFKVPLQDTPQDPGNAVLHSLYFILVDRSGQIRGYYDSTDPARLAALKTEASALTLEAEPLLKPTSLPAVNACLNGLSAALLLLGLLAIKARRIDLHKYCMMAAFSVSCLFLVSYLYYHARFGSTRFPGTGGLRMAYLAILLSHTILAASVPVLAPLTLYRGMTDQIEKHVRLARWTFPIWLYVSVTGVVVYWMLYRLAPGMGGTLQ